MSNSPRRFPSHSKAASQSNQALRPHRVADGEKGLLIAFEGPDGSGKSTQLKLLKQWFVSQGHDVVTTKWKSAPVISSLIKERKEAKNLSPEENCLLHAADLLFRLETVIVPALQRGKIVLCDRYIFTSLARDVARGLSKDWVLSIYEPILWPDLVFYFSVSSETALQRILTTRQPKHYEAGQDITNLADPCESFKVFIRRVIEQYQRMARQYQFRTVDAEQSIQAQHRYICAALDSRYEAAGKLHILQPAIQPFSTVGAPLVAAQFLDA